MEWILSVWRRLTRPVAVEGYGGYGGASGPGGPQSSTSTDGRLKLELARARRHERPLSLLVVGLRPHPGVPASRNGQLARRLASLAPRLGEYVRETDAAWWIEDADHFVVLLTECEKVAARQTGTRIVRDLRAEVGGGLDFGVAEYPTDGLAIRDLLELAGDFLQSPLPPEARGHDIRDIVTSDA